jgi:hypothetical protein
MIGVVGFFEINYKNVCSGNDFAADLWRESLKPLGLTHLIFVDEDSLNPSCGDLSITYEVYPTLKEVLNNYQSVNKVFIDLPKNLQNYSFSYLEKFKHPEDALYILGSDSKGLDLSHISTKDSVVAIETANIFQMWSVVAAGIILYDRLIKGK